MQTNLSTNLDKNPEKSRKIQKKSRKIQKNPEKSRSSKQRLLILRQSEYLQLWRGFFFFILTHQGHIREVHLKCQPGIFGVGPNASLAYFLISLTLGIGTHFLKFTY